MDYKTAAAFTLRHRMFFNKGQLESSFEMFPVGGGLVNMKAFLDKIKSVDPAPGTIYSSISPSSPNKCVPSPQPSRGGRPKVHSDATPALRCRRSRARLCGCAPHGQHALLVFSAKSRASPPPQPARCIVARPRKQARSPLCARSPCTAEA